MLQGSSVYVFANNLLTCSENLLIALTLSVAILANDFLDVPVVYGSWRQVSFYWAVRKICEESI